MMASQKPDHVAQVMSYSWLSNLQPIYEEEYIVAEDKWQSRLTCGNLAVTGLGNSVSEARQKAAKSFKEEYANRDGIQEACQYLSQKSSRFLSLQYNSFTYHFLKPLEPLI